MQFYLKFESEDALRAALTPFDEDSQGLEISIVGVNPATGQGWYANILAEALPAELEQYRTETNESGVGWAIEE